MIEFPVLKVSGRTFETESIFHQYVEPQVHGVGDFCTKVCTTVAYLLTQIVSAYAVQWNVINKEPDILPYYENYLIMKITLLCLYQVSC